ncbi:MAG: crosslink repair DNA glycosylase YcaQ family protein [Chloroflexota bacterium]
MVDEIEELQVVHYQDILNIRNPRYRCTVDLKIVRRAEAVKFIDEVGVALLFPGDNMALPDLWSAINGYQRAIPKHHHDSALGKAWNWKDEIPTRKEAWYGKLIRGKPAFISLETLPAVYAMSPNYGELDDYLEAYADGVLSKEAKEIYEALMQNGPMPTSDLRKAVGMKGGGDNARRFERAIAELQTGLKIVKSGISDSNRWKYCYVYDLLLRWMPTLGETARTFTGRTAMRHLITRYLETSVAAPVALFPRLFGWEAGVTERVTNEMLTDGTLYRVRVVGGPGITPRQKPSPEGDIWVGNRG